MYTERGGGERETYKMQIQYKRLPSPMLPKLKRQHPLHQVSHR